MYQSFKHPKCEERLNLGSDTATPLEEEIPFEGVLLSEGKEENKMDNQDLPRQ